MNLYLCEPPDRAGCVADCGLHCWGLMLKPCRERLAVFEQLYVGQAILQVFLGRSCRLRKDTELLRIDLVYTFPSPGCQPLPTALLLPTGRCVAAVSHESVRCFGCFFLQDEALVPHNPADGLLVRQQAETFRAVEMSRFDGCNMLI